MKLLKRVAVLTLTVLMLATPTAYALDTGDPDNNMTEIETTFLAFEKALMEQMVKDGYITQADANEEISLLIELLSGPEDFIYEIFRNGGMPLIEPTMAKTGKQGILIKTYAELTGRSTKDIAKMLEAEKLTLWELAKREGKIEALQKKIIEMKVLKLDALVKEGKITQKERDTKINSLLEKFKEMLDQPKTN